MTCARNIMQLIFFLTLAIILVFLRTTFVYANISGYLNATIKISICGNEIIEGGEDCEGENLNGQTCESLGFGPGTLSCDIACSFDTYGCSAAPSPTPTPTPTSTPTPISSPTSTPTPTTVASTLEVTPTSSPVSTTETVTPTVTQSPVTKPALPLFLTPFDPDGDGKIALKEIFVVAKSWVEEWREALIEEIVLAEKGLTSKKERKCDLNKDYRCDLKDFSILMSYVEK